MADPPATSALPDLADYLERLERGGHRDRLLAAMARSVKERGFRATTVADVVRLARTSRRTFYEHFEDRGDCFLALFEATGALAIARVTAAVEPAAPWEEQIDTALDAYLRHTFSEPALMKSYVDELSAIGARGVEFERRAGDAFAALLVRLVEQSRSSSPEIPPLTTDTALLLVGGIRELLTRAIEDGRDPDALRPVLRSAARAILRP